MQTFQNHFCDGQWQQPLTAMPDSQVVFVFGEYTLACDGKIRDDLATYFPNAECIGCTTAGEILGNTLLENSLCLTAIAFDETPVRVVDTQIDGRPLREVAEELAGMLDHKGLRHVLVISDGHDINGTDLAEGLARNLPDTAKITGGLAGDGLQFKKTIVWRNDDAETGKIVLCGLYGDAVEVGCGCVGGWDPFGPTRMVTESSGNILYALDDQPALDLYKKYLGDHANDLPGSALFFPLYVQKQGISHPVVRTILNVVEDDASMIFAGDVPVGSTAQLMRANFDSVIDGAGLAAEKANIGDPNSERVALLISCVCRKLVLKARTEDELDAVAEVLGEHCTMTGFYSYGEIAPIENQTQCALHNQTMTITVISERRR